MFNNRVYVIEGRAYFRCRFRPRGDGLLDVCGLDPLRAGPGLAFVDRVLSLENFQLGGVLSSFGNCSSWVPPCPDI